jgi:hypothetical protein
MKLLGKKYLTYFLWQIWLVAGRLAGCAKVKTYQNYYFFALQEQTKL